MAILRILTMAGNATILIALAAYYSSCAKGDERPMKGLDWFFVLLSAANIAVAWGAK